MPITTVIFDFDGTLASSLEGIHICFLEAMEMFGYPRPSVDDVRRTVGLSLEESVRILTKGQSGGASIGSIVCVYRKLYTEKGRSIATLFPAAMETLSAVRSMGIQIAVVSNKSHKGLYRMAEHLGVDGMIDVMQGVEDGSFRKPDPRWYTEGIAQHLKEPHGCKVLMVGDTESDILFAKNAGLQSCWAAYGYGEAAVCTALGPEFILHDIAQLPGLIRSINSGE